MSPSDCGDQSHQIRSDFFFLENPLKLFLHFPLRMTPISRMIRDWIYRVSPSKKNTYILSVLESSLSVKLLRIQRFLSYICFWKDGWQPIWLTWLSPSCRSCALANNLNFKGTLLRNAGSQNGWGLWKHCPKVGGLLMRKICCGTSADSASKIRTFRRGSYKCSGGFHHVSRCGLIRVSALLGDSTPKKWHITFFFFPHCGFEIRGGKKIHSVLHHVSYDADFPFK